MGQSQPNRGLLDFFFSRFDDVFDETFCSSFSFAHHVGCNRFGFGSSFGAGGFSFFNHFFDDFVDNGFSFFSNGFSFLGHRFSFDSNGFSFFSNGFGFFGDSFSFVLADQLASGFFSSVDRDFAFLPCK